MRIDLTKIYDGADLSGAVSGVIYLPVVRNSTLEKVSARSDAAQAGAAVFEVRKNNVVIAGLSGLTIPGGAKVGAVSGLSVALADGDEITLNLLSGDVSAPVTLNLTVEDGQSGGSQLPSGDLNAETNYLNKIQGVAVRISNGTAPVTIDDFEDADFSDKWQVVLNNGGTTAVQLDGKITWTLGGSGYYTIESKTGTIDLPLNDKRAELTISSVVTAGSSGCAWLAKIGGEICRFEIDSGAITLTYAAETLLSETYPSTNQPLKWGIKYDASAGRILFQYFTSAGGWVTRAQKTGLTGVRLYTLSALYAGTYGGVTGASFTVNNLEVTAGGEPLADQSLLWFNQSANRYENVTLGQLKAALAAI